MKRSIVITVALCSLLSLTAFAQTPTPPATRPATTQSAPAAAAAVAGGTGAEGKIALINTAKFRDAITELKAKGDSINAEFEPRNKELQAMQEELNNLKNKITNQGNTVQPAVLNQWRDEAAEKERQLKRRVEDLEAVFNKRVQEVTEPIYARIGAALETYAKQKGIALVLEGNALQQSQALVYAVLAMDITDDFVAEYNKTSGGAKR